MKDRFHLETYREHEIWYNANTDKFTVELLIEDNWREKSRKSLNDCRKAIDEHIKANNEFKPIKIIIGEHNMYSQGKEATIVSVRSDGGLIIEVDGKNKSEIIYVEEQLAGKQIRYNLFNPEYIEWVEKYNKFQEDFSIERKELIASAPKLEPLDLSFVNIYKKPN